MKLNLFIVLLMTVVGLGGFFLGQTLSSNDTPCPACPEIPSGTIENSSGKHHSVTLAKNQPSEKDSNCSSKKIDSLRKELEELRALSNFQKTVLDGYKAQEKEKLGTPIPWTSNVPSQYREEEFLDIVSQALDELESPVELIGFDCQEYPCIAVTRVLKGLNSELENTEIWNKNFGSKITSSYQNSISCGDDREERIHMISPYWDGKTDPKNLPPGTYEKQFREELNRRINQPKHKRDKEEEKKQENRSKRLNARWNSIVQNWNCLPLTTD
jgi:hypothetical protein